MYKNFSNEWKDYHKIIEDIEKLQVQANLFPGRKNVKDQIKRLRNKLFLYYECFTNKSNTVNPIVLKRIMKDWFTNNCHVKTPHEVDKWLNEQKWEKEMVVAYIADEIIGKNLEKLCFMGGMSFCPQTQEDELSCIEKLIHEIVKISDRYIHIPNTDENFELFLNGASQYLKKEVTRQESYQSPIENIMYEALLPIAKKHNLKLEMEYPVYDEGRIEIRYSLDLAFINREGEPVLNVETDGLSYHQGYRNMARDRERDRWLLIRGIPVMRFTSREVFNDLDNAVVQVDAALTNLTRKF